MHDHPTASVITQQYSSATFISLRLHSLKEKFGLRLNIFFFSKIVRPELCKSESVCSVNRHFRAFSLSNHDNVRRKPQPLLAHHLP
jgi:hypothetical protein